MLTLFAVVTSRPLTFQELTVIPEVGEKWYDFGIALGVNEQILDSIMNKATKPYKKKIDMLRAFLRSPDPTWRRVISALESCDEHEVAKRVCETYNLPLTLLYDDTKLKEKTKVETAPVQFSPQVPISSPVQSDCRHKSYTDVVDSNADKQRVFRESSPPCAEQLNFSHDPKSFVSDGEHDEPHLSSSEAMIVTSSRSKKTFQHSSRFVLSDGVEHKQTVSFKDDRNLTQATTSSQHQKSSRFSAGSPKSESSEYHSFSNDDSGPLLPAEVPTVSVTSTCGATSDEKLNLESVSSEKETKASSNVGNDAGDSGICSATSFVSKPSLSFSIQKEFLSTTSVHGSAVNSEHVSTGLTGNNSPSISTTSLESRKVVMSERHLVKDSTFGDCIAVKRGPMDNRQTVEEPCPMVCM